ncbi:MAG: imidazole glycerol phosphate synthase subunit HisH [Solirubrobacterales bacterium]|nr:imidazole glycerol phosphate synthase subunit HisH [Solirubrobacterales bacterium]
MSGSRLPDDGAAAAIPVPGPVLTVLDYGMGNLRSVEKALELVGARVSIAGDPDSVPPSSGLVLPGVGAFPRAMSRIRDCGFDRLIEDSLAEGTPLLGICLGLQLLFEHSDELGGSTGLGILPGRVKAIPAGGRKVPHIGWSPVTWRAPDRLNDGLRPGEPFYFVHSYACEPDPVDLVGTASYGGTFACVAGRGPVQGVQFHPEKSGVAGLRLLRNFVRICSETE